MGAAGADGDGAGALPMFGSTPEEAANSPGKEAPFPGSTDPAGWRSTRSGVSGRRSVATRGDGIAVPLSLFPPVGAACSGPAESGPAFFRGSSSRGIPVLPEAALRGEAAPGTMPSGGIAPAFRISVRTGPGGSGRGSGPGAATLSREISMGGFFRLGASVPPSTTRCSGSGESGTWELLFSVGDASWFATMCRSTRSPSSRFAGEPDGTSARRGTAETPWREDGDLSRERVEPRAGNGFAGIPPGEGARSCPVAMAPATPCVGIGNVMRSGVAALPSETAAFFFSRGISGDPMTGTALPSETAAGFFLGGVSGAAMTDTARAAGDIAAIAVPGGGSADSRGAFPILSFRRISFSSFRRISFSARFDSNGAGGGTRTTVAFLVPGTDPFPFGTRESSASANPADPASRFLPGFPVRDAPCAGMVLPLPCGGTNALMGSLSRSTGSRLRRIPHPSFRESSPRPSP